MKLGRICQRNKSRFTPLEKRSSLSGFTLLELMISAAIVVVALTGLLATYVDCLVLSETTKNTNLALNAAQGILEEIRTATFSAIYTNYNGYTFGVSGMAGNAGLGRVTIDNANSSLLNVVVGVCWEQKSGRIIGECQSTNGTLSFSDNNSNGVLDSPVQITTLVAQR